MALDLHNDYFPPSCYKYLQLIQARSEKEKKMEERPAHFDIAVLFLGFPFPAPKASGLEVVPSQLVADPAPFF